MSGRWVSSSRRQRLPHNWRDIRLVVLERDNWTCQIQMQGICVGTAREVDHVQRGDDHSLNNLASACTPCHAKKSSLEGNARKRELRDRRRRLEERHPGER